MKKLRDILKEQMRASIAPGMTRIAIETYINRASDETLASDVLKAFNALGYAIEHSGVFETLPVAQETSSEPEDVPSISLPL